MTLIRIEKQNDKINTEEEILRKWELILELSCFFDHFELN